MFSVLKIFNKNLIILRDDLLGQINGNKARKLAILNELKLPYSHIISYGSSQSNAMQALSVFTRQNKLKFSFVCARQAPIVGNLENALKNGANIYYASKYAMQPREFAFKIFLSDSDSFFIEEGVCNDFARFGFYQMAREIASLAKELDADVFLPSGTYTSAIYLEKYLAKLAPSVRVFCTACVSADEYFKKQIARLNPSSKLQLLKTKRKYHFAKLYEELFILTQSIKQPRFELLYDSVGLCSIYENLDALKSNIIYIHQGGLLGDETMQERYKLRFKIAQTKA